MSEMSLLVLCLMFLVVAVTIAIYPLSRQTYRAQLAIAFVLIAGSIGGYWQWGSRVKWVGYLHQQAIHQRAEAVMKSLKGPQELIDKLKHHLEKQPDSARGWFLLGRLYASQTQWTDAFNAFSKAHALEPDNLQTTVNYAQSLWQIKDQTFTPEVRQLFESILKNNPNQPDALSMLAIDAYQQHEYQQAIEYWSSLLRLLPKDSSEAMAIRKAIAKAQRDSH